MLQASSSWDKRLKNHNGILCEVITFCNKIVCDVFLFLLYILYLLEYNFFGFNNIFY